MKTLPSGPATLHYGMIENNLEHGGALRLADRIRAYWQRKGLSPKVWLDIEHPTQSAADVPRSIFVVRSDMVGGWPR